MIKENLREEILSHIQLPQIKKRKVSALEYGVLPHSGKNERQRLQRAIDSLSASGGGTLLLPAGVYLTGSLWLKSGVELHFESSETIVTFVSYELEENYPLAFSHWEASPCMNFSALLYAYGQHDIAITGPGICLGSASRERWWDWHHQVEAAWSSDQPDLQQPDRLALRRMNLEGVPARERVFGQGHYLRPNFLQFLHCERVLLEGFTLKDSPMWQLNPVLCRSVVLDGVTASSHGPNNDGCDPESCHGVWIKNCTFDTGDDCISLKSGRDRDGREARIPCEYVLIENNRFVDGHGGIALGSEMSGGIRKVLSVGNHFSSPHLTYPLRLKTNARRGGFVSDVMFCDSTIEEVHGAAIHGTMLYEDGRNGSDLPVFENITIENVKASGGEYGIFLEAFAEVPLKGLVLRNIRIEGVRKELRSLNWQDPLLENVQINGKPYPRPGFVRILGIPRPGEPCQATAQHCGGSEQLTFHWVAEGSDGNRKTGEGECFTIPKDAVRVWVRARDEKGNEEQSCIYCVLPKGGWAGDSLEAALLKDWFACRGMDPGGICAKVPVTRSQVARLLLPLAEADLPFLEVTDSQEPCILLAAANGFFPLDESGRFHPEKGISRQEMATVAMQACGVSYLNASSTRPVCLDASRVGDHYATNVARSLYYGFMELENGFFHPFREVTGGEAMAILKRVAEYAGV